MDGVEICIGGWEVGAALCPYFMFMIERVTEFYFSKDGMHTVYKIEKTQPAVATQGVGSSHAHVNIPESSRSSVTP